jgi:hypothetical protein
VGENLLAVLFDPRTNLRALSRRTPIGLALFVLIVGQLSASVAIHLAMAGPPGMLPFVDWYIRTVLNVALAVGGCAFLHMFASLMGGSASPDQLFWTLVVGDAPWLFATPLLVIATALGQWKAVLFVPVVASIFAFLTAWSIGIKAAVMAEIYGMSGGRSLFAYLAGYGAVLVVLVVLSALVPTVAFVWLIFIGQRLH